MKISSALRNRVAKYIRTKPHIKAAFVEADMRLALLRHSVAHVIPQVIQPEPGTLMVAITASCNLRCIGCRYGRDFMPGAQLPWPIVRDLLDDARQGGFRSVRIYGGEPLLHPDLAKMVSHSLKLGFSTYVTTNGILLGEKIDELYSAGLRIFTIGFYGVGEHYNLYVQRKDRFSRLKESIGRVRRQYGMDVRLRINWLLSRQSCSLDAWYEAWNFAQEYKTPIQVDLVHYSLPYFTEGPDRQLQFRPEDHAAIERVVSELIHLKRRHPKMIEHSEIGLASIPDWITKGPDMRVPCDAYQMTWVGADGTVQLCYVTFKLGNLHEKRLSEMLFGDEHKAAARDAYAVRCPNCHCSYDLRVQKDFRSRRKYADRLINIVETRSHSAGRV
jgi:MoaA/NifB/PqqE/SkfB family radical SAM enzyme